MSVYILTIKDGYGEDKFVFGTKDEAKAEAEHMTGMYQKKPTFTIEKQKYYTV